MTSKNPTPFKLCPCGLSYSHAEWMALPFVGFLDKEEDDDQRLELRNCPACRSTLSVDRGAPSPRQAAPQACMSTLESAEGPALPPAAPPLTWHRCGEYRGPSLSPPPPARAANVMARGEYRVHS
jgi:hypothetical protein